MSESAVLELIGISKEYKQGRSLIEIFKNVNFSIKPAELTAIVGSSGSGKSTLLHIAGLLDKPNSGFVKICGQEASKAQSAQLNLFRLRYIGFIYQKHYLLSNFSAIENVAMPKLIAGESFDKSLKESGALLDELGLSHRAYNMPGELSGGEQQRVAIARSLINKPKLILADEPTGNLDPKTANEVFKLFLNLVLERKTAIVMVTHNYEIAKRMNSCYELSFGNLAKMDLK